MLISSRNRVDELKVDRATVQNWKYYNCSGCLGMIFLLLIVFLGLLERNSVRCSTSTSSTSSSSSTSSRGSSSSRK